MKSEKTDAGNRLSFSNAQKYFLSAPNDSRIATALGIFFWAGILVILGWLFYFAIVTIIMPYQIEYREGAAQVMTQILLRGGNPFSSENQPFAFNNYGIVYNLVVLPLAALFGNTLLVHRSVTFLFIIFSCLLILQTIYRFNHDRYFAIAGAVFVLMGLAGSGGNGAYPSAMGTFLFLGAILIPFNRSFDPFSLSLSAIICVITYYTKPYFVLSFGIVASYMFVFVSKKKGLLYSFLFVTLFIFSYLVVRYSCKYYFIDTFVSNWDSRTGDASWAHESKQLLESIQELYPSIILAAVVLLLNSAKLRLRNISPKGLFSGLDFLSIDRPFIAQPLNYFAYFFVCSSLAFVLVLGSNTGAYMTYLYQIMLPPFYLLLFQSIKPVSRLALISLLLILLNMALFGWLRFNPDFLKQKDSTQWAMLYQYVDSSKHILNTPIITSEMIRVGLLPVDSGQTEYIYAIGPYPNNKLIGPNYDEVKQNGAQYKALIHNSVVNAQYDQIFTAKELRSFAPADIGKYYSRVHTLKISMPQVGQQWTVEIWEPKP